MKKNDEPAPSMAIEIPEHRTAPPWVETLASDLPYAALSRRKFMGLIGTSAALAGLSLSGCIRKPKEPIVPFSARPEDLIPGEARYYATSAFIGGAVLGLVVESFDGRPIKIEGNTQHPASRGATNAWAQAEILELYDPDRSRKPLRQGKEDSWDHVASFLQEHCSALSKIKGRGLALLLEYRPSPTLASLVEHFQRVYPAARVYLHDPAYPRQTLAGAALVGMPRHRAVLNLEQADIIVALDADFLHTEGDAVKNQRLFSRRRNSSTKNEPMNRLYVVEPFYTTTGAMADHRLPLRSSEIAGYLAALASHLFEAGLPWPAGAEALKGTFTRGSKIRYGKWISAVADDLMRHRGRSLLLVGEHQPAAVHALAHLLNVALGGMGQTIQLQQDPTLLSAGTIEELAHQLRHGAITSLIMVGGNPAYDAPADLQLAALLPKVAQSVHLSCQVNETSQLCTWHLPRSHFLEAWGDLRATDGTCSIQQPLIAPLFSSLSEIELLARLVPAKTVRGYELVRTYWAERAARATPFDHHWRRWLHDGVIEQALSSRASVTGATSTASPHPAPTVTPSSAFSDKEAATGAILSAPPTAPTAAGTIITASVSPSSSGGMPPSARAAEPAIAPHTWHWARLLQDWSRSIVTPHPSPGLEITYRLDPSVFDGRYANNGWLQECPDPISKLTWDNAAHLSPATAARLGLNDHELVELQVQGRSLQLPVSILPGAVDNAVLVSLGYGRTAGGRLARQVGANGFFLRRSSAPYFAGGLQLKKTGRRSQLALAQEQPTMADRPIIREGTLAEYQAHPGFAKQELEFPLRSLWTEPNPRGGQQWAMSIDLSACTGCNACVIACQAENNIPVVGKERVIEHRIMHWLRVDRYFTGEPSNPAVRYLPLPCQQCENAPCEQVCPVAATAHSPEGLNDQAYNRCIGTRYCSNNCPFKVRRFNFFQYNDVADELEKMQKNPHVTMRFRGVMEKCTYCIQRIQEEKIKAKRNGQSTIQDGVIVPACAQACPTQAIVFGDQNNSASAVARQKREPRSYALLAELNIKPRTTYLAKLTNPNPELR